MAELIVLLRGVNVGKGRALPMADLRARLDAEGATSVKTYIQSGNIVLDPPPGVADIEDWLTTVVTDQAGFDVPVVLRSRDQLAETARGNPYPEAGGTTLHVTFFPTPPDPDLLADIDPTEMAPEQWTLAGRDLYLHLPDGMGRSALAAAVEKAFRRRDPADRGTTRNWNTVQKLLALADPSGGG